MASLMRLPSLSRSLAKRATAALARRAATNIKAILLRAEAACDVKVEFRDDLWPSDAVIERLGGGAIRVTYCSTLPPFWVVHLSTYAAAYAYWFTACTSNVQRMTVTLSDGDEPSRARFSPSSHKKEQLPIPDPFFFRDRGFRVERLRASSALNWDLRSDPLVWRGALNGYGKIGFDPEDVNDPTVLARLRMLLLLRGVPDCDAATVLPKDQFYRWRNVLTEQGLAGSPVAEATWLGRKFALDIDGFSNTWSNLLIRMLYGCCVLKVESQLGLRQWYYYRIKPFEHYVPVRADMSDLTEKIDWARSHNKEAQEIASNGQRFAMALDFEAGKRDAVEIITANWDH